MAKKKENDDKWYYEKQLSRLEVSNEYFMTVQLFDFKGNKTNNLSLNNDSIEVLIAYLNKLKREVKNG